MPRPIQENPANLVTPDQAREIARRQVIDGTTGRRSDPLDAIRAELQERLRAGVISVDEASAQFAVAEQQLRDVDEIRQAELRYYLDTGIMPEPPRLRPPTGRWYPTSGTIPPGYYDHTGFGTMGASSATNLPRPTAPPPDNPLEVVVASRVFKMESNNSGKWRGTESSPQLAGKAIGELPTECLHPNGLPKVLVGNELAMMVVEIMSRQRDADFVITRRHAAEEGKKWVVEIWIQPNHAWRVKASAEHDQLAYAICQAISNYYR